ncbi:helix-turn-helix transcriptional regulator [Spirosoma foliorum]|uniref:HTH luxR-type domain-containing protein n=1 Tax=Spirosoma foliorum TaxID=2710596 RepID=A0A7G5GNH1_9BACT|nr:helix-turn-helix transcriptional regulator [Spirosoma foliorum]QMW00413.1 hypothetical protein H3H32_20635 [Spirosoma foliorum]
MSTYDYSFSLIRKIWRSDLLEPNIAEIEELIQVNPLLHETLLLQGTALAILDISTFQYVGMWGDLENLVGWSKEELFEGGAAFYMSKFLPADQAGFTIISQLINDYVRRFSPAELPSLRTIYDYRIMRKDGQQVRIGQESVILKADSEGRMLYSLALASDISHLNKEGTQHLCFLNGSERQLYAIDTTTDQYRQIDVLSRREMQIAQLLSQNLTSEQIAEQLFISTHTVNTHRQKMIRKMGLGNTTDLLNFLKIYRLI